MKNSHILTALLIGGGVGVVAKLSGPVWQILGGVLMLVGLILAVMSDYETLLEKEEEKQNDN